MWLVCKRGKCNQFSSINTFWNVNLRISQLKQTDSEGRVEIDFDSRVKVSMLECGAGLECSVAPSSHLSQSDIDLESRTLSLLSDQIYCYSSTRTLNWILCLWYLFPKISLRFSWVKKIINEACFYLFNSSCKSY